MQSWNHEAEALGTSKGEIIMNNEALPIREILTEVLCMGVRVPDTLLHNYKQPIRSFLVEGISVNIPIDLYYVSKSPYSMKPVGDTSYMLVKNGKEIATAEVIPAPAFHSLKTEDGISYSRIAHIHGSSSLGSSVRHDCLFLNTPEQCIFCNHASHLQKLRGIGEKNPEQIAEVIKAAFEEGGFEDVTLTGGIGTPPGSEIRHMAKCVSAIKAVAELPVQVQIAPPQDFGLLELLKEAGTDTVGIHIECYDDDMFPKIVPGKAAIGKAHYIKAWKKAVELFGFNQVQSFLVVGVGESPESVIEGSRVMADLGVYPFVVPFIPYPGTDLEDRPPCDPTVLSRINTEVAKVLKDKGLSAKNFSAGCVRCGTCSTLHAYEES